MPQQRLTRSDQCSCTALHNSHWIWGKPEANAEVLQVCVHASFNDCYGAIRATCEPLR